MWNEKRTPVAQCTHGKTSLFYAEQKARTMDNGYNGYWYQLQSEFRAINSAVRGSSLVRCAAKIASHDLVLNSTPTSRSIVRGPRVVRSLSYR